MSETIFNQPKSSFLVVSYAQKHVNSAPSLNNPAYPLSTLPLPWLPETCLFTVFEGSTQSKYELCTASNTLLAASYIATVHSPISHALL